MGGCPPGRVPLPTQPRHGELRHGGAGGHGWVLGSPRSEGQRAALRAVSGAGDVAVAAAVSWGARSELPLPLQQVTWVVNGAGATNEIFGRPWGGSTRGGFDCKTLCLSTGANFLHPRAPGCSGTRGGDTSSTPRVAPAPHPRCGNTLPPGDQHIANGSLVSRPPWSDRARPPVPSRTRCPVPPPRQEQSGSVLT